MKVGQTAVERPIFCALGKTRDKAGSVGPDISDNAGGVAEKNCFSAFCKAIGRTNSKFSAEMIPISAFDFANRLASAEKRAAFCSANAALNSVFDLGKFLFKEKMTTN